MLMLLYSSSNDTSILFHKGQITLQLKVLFLINDTQFEQLILIIFLQLLQQFSRLLRAH